MKILFAVSRLQDGFISLERMYIKKKLFFCLKTKIPWDIWQSIVIIMNFGMNISLYGKLKTDLKEIDYDRFAEIYPNGIA